MNEKQVNSIKKGFEKFKQNYEGTIAPEMESIIANLEPDDIEGLTYMDNSERVKDLLEYYVYKQERLKYLEEQGRIYGIQEIENREKMKRYRIKLYKRGIAIALGAAALTSTVLFREQIGGKISEVVNTIIEADNNKLQTKYEDMSNSVEELTGMTPEEIMKNGRSL